MMLVFLAALVPAFGLGELAWAGVAAVAVLLGMNTRWCGTMI